MNILLECFENWDHVVSAEYDDGTPLTQAEIQTLKDIRHLDLNALHNVVITDICKTDYPDFCDAFIESADYKGVELTDQELDIIQEHFQDWVYEQILNEVF